MSGFAKGFSSFAKMDKAIVIGFEHLDEYSYKANYRYEVVKVKIL
jgi:hypothetical protein